MGHSDTGSLEALTSLALSELGVNMSSRILCAVSGGADSVTMAHVLNELVNQGQFNKLALIHINHGLRDAESNADEIHVRGISEKLRVPLYVFNAQTLERSRTNGVGLEEAARDDRYESFINVATKDKFDIVVTAHTINDTLETVLNNMVRGTGLRGLRGIPPRRPLTEDVDVIRPWLQIERSDVLQYAEQHGITYRHDSSNDSLQFLRNRLRHNVIPALEKSFPGRNIYDGFRRTLKNISEAAEELSMTAKTLVKLCSIDITEEYLLRDAYMCSDLVLSSKDEALRRAFVMEVLETRLREPYHLSLDSVQTMILSSFLDEPTKTELLLTPDILFTKVFDDSDELEDFSMGFESENEDEDDYANNIDLRSQNLIIERLRPYPELWQQELVIGSSIETHVGILSAFTAQKNTFIFEAGDAYFDALSLQGQHLVVRPWQEGDRIAPFGMEGHTKLVSDILNEAGISSYHKKMCVVVALASDLKSVLWVPGLRAAEFGRITDGTETVLILRRTPVYRN
jgi:tRNA(Ile)-lysidine synthase